MLLGSADSMALTYWPLDFTVGQYSTALNISLGDPQMSACGVFL